MTIFVSILLKRVKIQQCICHPELIKFLVLHPILHEQNHGKILSFLIVADLHIMISSSPAIICGSV